MEGVFAAPTQKESFSYTAKVKGVEKFKNLMEGAEKLSQLITPDDSFVVSSESVLRDFLMSDIESITEYLESYGFYDAKVFPEIDIKDGVYNVVMRVYLGEQYTINNINVYVNGKAQDLPKEVLDISRGSPGVNEKILKNKSGIARWFKENGCPFVEVLEERVEINDEALFVNVNYYFNIGPSGVFGDSEIIGAESVNTEYVRRFISWVEGEPYDIRKVKSTEQKLMETNLFDSVLITSQKQNSSDKFPIKIKLHERTHHSVKVNLYLDASLSSSDSQAYEVGIIPKYSYNNLFGNNERFEANTILSYNTQDVNVSLKKPHIFMFDLSARVFGSAERRDHVPYFRSGFDAGLGGEYKITESFLTSFGVQYENYSLTRKTDDAMRDYSFISMPLAAHAEWLDDKMFSTKGFKATVQWSPFLSSEQSLYKTNISLATYIPIVSSKISLALWGKWGALSGADFNDAPIDKRLYLGGEQNLRGYSKDSLGSVSALKDNPKEVIPDGGLSSVAGGVEARFIVFGNFGFAAFANAGQISKDVNVFDGIHSFDDVYIDVGGSLFYFVPNIGPIRVDVAHPIGKNIPKDQDNFKLNLTFGQAF